MYLLKNGLSYYQLTHKRRQQNFETIINGILLMILQGTRIKWNLEIVKLGRMFFFLESWKVNLKSQSAHTDSTQYSKT